MRGPRAGTPHGGYQDAMLPRGRGGRGSRRLEIGAFAWQAPTVSQETIRSGRAVGIADFSHAGTAIPDHKEWKPRSCCKPGHPGVWSHPRENLATVVTLFPGVTIPSVRAA